ncbi:hypothetical protein [Ilumatobacter sp.]|uniref:hypothetical protein n=1 Tax=Ilumatobacter sp. TaxID=1967498 RepID=UPI003AF612D2
MKTKLAVALSMVGVLGAGSAAAVVNTQILDGGPAASGTSAAILPPPSTVDVTVPSVDVTMPATTLPGPTTGTEPPPSAIPIAVESPTPTTPAASGFLTAFNVGDAGIVTVDVLDGRIVLVSSEPLPGWRVTDVEPSDGGDVEVSFSSGTVRVEFTAELVDGQIVPRVESERIGGSTAAAAPTPTTPAVPAPPPPVDDDDEDDDEHEVEDDEADDEERDDDEDDDEERDDD